MSGLNVGLLAWVTLAWMWTQSAVASKPVIEVSAIEWRPFMSKSYEGGGYCLKATREALKRAGYDMVVHFVPWSRSLSGIKNGIYHLQPAVWYEPSRTEFLTYTQPYGSNKIVLVSRRDQAIKFTEPRKLIGYRIGVARNYSYPPVIMNEPNLIFDLGEDVRTNLRKLQAKRIDVTLGDAAVLRFETQALFDTQDVFFFDENVIEDRPLHMTISKQYKGYEVLRTKLNQSIQSMIEDGTLKSYLQHSPTQ